MSAHSGRETAGIEFPRVIAVSSAVMPVSLEGFIFKSSVVSGKSPDMVQCRAAGGAKRGKSGRTPTQTLYQPRINLTRGKCQQYMKTNVS
jgi:hypothetical protein